MTRKKISRLAAGLVLLAVLLTQVGMALLHTHQARPDQQPVALQAACDTVVSCQACALDGMVTLALDVEAIVLPEFLHPSFVRVLTGGILLPVPASASGRAPPVC